MTTLKTLNYDNLDEPTMWQAVLDRDAQYRGAFVYAVRSTGIYCLPTCPSRRPRRSQVTFFSSAEAAEAAGYRACRRCQPRLPISVDEQMVEKARRLLEQHVENPISLRELSQMLHLSPSHLQRIFKSKTGLTPRQYLSNLRLNEFKERIRSGETITSAMYGAGYSSSSRLYENAANNLGMTPAVYQKGGQGVLIRYTIVETPLGRTLVATTPKGICFICFGDDDKQLQGFLSAEYPAAIFHRDDEALSAQVELITRHLEGHHPDICLPLDVQATAFRLRVWEALRKIPYGSTRTYAEVAQAIGQPKAVRAVASACANNPVPLVTPCHRVVRSDGKAGEYRWGEARKRDLLSREVTTEINEKAITDRQ